MMAMMMAPPSVRAVVAESSDVPLTVSAVGTAESIASVDIKSRVTGQVLRVRFQEGQEVRQGQVLFEIDPEPLQRQIAQLQADLGKDEAMEQQSRANVVRDQAQLKQTQAAADRGLALSKEGIFSKEQTEQVVATAATSQAALDADKAAVDSALAAIQSDRARLSQTQLQLSYTSIVAPINGRAGAVAIKAGNLVKENDTTLVSILQISPIYVSFGVPEQMLGDVRRFQAQRALVVHASPSDTTGETASGVLKFIDNTVDNTTGTIKLKAEFANGNHVLWPGQFINVQAQLQIERGRVLIPSRTVQTGPQGKYVWVMDEKTQTVAMRPVQVLRNVQIAKAQASTGRDAAPSNKGGASADLGAHSESVVRSNSFEEQSVIGDGLRAGEHVISEGQMRLAPGMKVQLLGAQAAAPAAGQM